MTLLATPSPSTADLTALPAHALAQAIRARQVSAVEVLAAHLDRIARLNPALNAIVTLNTEAAWERARAADAALARGEVWGPLHGVPLTVKDVFETAGVRTTAGFPPLAGYVPAEDATAVARLRAAGAILVGKTNTPVLAGDFQTANPLFGRTNNPWDQTRTPGGSSGGSAAALAAGLTPLELGSDIKGSIRIPAHYCGVYGLKPTDGRVPLTGHIPEPPGAPRGIRHMATIGPLARSLDDLTLALRVIAGPDGRRWETPPVPLGAARVRPLRELRLAWTDRFGDVPVTGDTRAALAALAAELARRGCRIEQRLPAGFDFTVAWETWGELYQAEAGATMPPEMEAALAEQDGLAPDAPDPMARGQARALQATMRDYVATLGRRDALIGQLEGFFDEWDALLCPVTVGPAVPHGPSSGMVAVDGQLVPYQIAGTAYCCPFNLTGHPAVVLPLARSGEGLPIGLQLVGRRWAELDLLAIAAQLADVIGPYQAPPALPA